MLCTAKCFCESSSNELRIAFWFQMLEQKLRMGLEVLEVSFRARWKSHYQSIKRTFDKVGQNPWSEDTEAFEKHLEALTLDSMYKCLNDNHTAAKLDQLGDHID